MKIVFVIVCVIVIVWSIASRKKIDKEEAIAIKTPGTAKRLREQYGELIDTILHNKGNQILFERSYDESIRIANQHHQELFLSCSFGNLHVVYIQDSSILKEWKFNKTDQIKTIYNEITQYFIE